jgi:hypothetical protein
MATPDGAWPVSINNVTTSGFSAGGNTNNSLYWYNWINFDRSCQPITAGTGNCPIEIGTNRTYNNHQEPVSFTKTYSSPPAVLLAPQGAYPTSASNITATGFSLGGNVTNSPYDVTWAAFDESCSAQLLGGSGCTIEKGRSNTGNNQHVPVTFSKTFSAPPVVIAVPESAYPVGIGSLTTTGFSAGGNAASNYYYNWIAFDQACFN